MRKKRLKFIRHMVKRWQLLTLIMILRDLWMICWQTNMQNSTIEETFNWSVHLIFHEFIC